MTNRVWTEFFPFVVKKPAFGRVVLLGVGVGGPTAPGRGLTHPFSPPLTACMVQTVLIESLFRSFRDNYSHPELVVLPVKLVDQIPRTTTSNFIMKRALLCTFTSSCLIVQDPILCEQTECSMEENRADIFLKTEFIFPSCCLSYCVGYDSPRVDHLENA
jgi:hypothetical protein